MLESPCQSDLSWQIDRRLHFGSGGSRASGAHFSGHNKLAWECILVLYLDAWQLRLFLIGATSRRRRSPFGKFSVYGSLRNERKRADLIRVRSPLSPVGVVGYAKFSRASLIIIQPNIFYRHPQRLILLTQSTCFLIAPKPAAIFQKRINIFRRKKNVALRYFFSKNIEIWDRNHCHCF